MSRASRLQQQVCEKRVFCLRRLVCVCVSRSRPLSVVSPHSLAPAPPPTLCLALQVEACAGWYSWYKLLHPHVSS